MELPMPRQCLYRLTVAGKVYVIHRDVTYIHPPAVHTALGTHSEAELQQYLDDCHPADYGDDGRHLGPDESGLELRWADDRQFSGYMIYEEF